MLVEFKQISGNDRLKEYFSQCVIDNTLPHAFILEGKKGSGKFTFALSVASAALCSSAIRPCGNCKNCRQIGENVAPDVRITELVSDKASISVDAVRAIKSDAPSFPCEGELKFYIIKDSDKLTVQAQNALLKILEEPPSFVVFILITENASLLLPTIRSRAPVFRMQSFDDSELRQRLVEISDKAATMQKNDPSVFERIIKSADGSIGKALVNLDNRTAGKLFERRETVVEMLNALNGVEKSAFMKFEDDLSSKRDELNRFICDLRSALRDILIRKKHPSDSYVFFESDEHPGHFASVMTADACVKAIEICDSVMNSNELNANVNLLKINFISALWKCVH